MTAVIGLLCAYALGVLTVAVYHVFTVRVHEARRAQWKEKEERYCNVLDAVIKDKNAAATAERLVAVQRLLPHLHHTMHVSPSGHEAHDPGQCEACKEATAITEDEL